MGTKTKDNILEDYADLGFRLVEEHDHFVDLYFKEVLIAHFNQVVVTQEILWQACEKYRKSRSPQNDSSS